MNKLILFALAAVAILGATSYLMMKKPALTAYPQEVIAAFNAYCSKYHKFSSGTDPDVIQYRLSVFYSNWKKIKHHSKHSTYTLRENELMDLTHEEFVKFYLGYRPDAEVTQQNVEIINIPVPNSVDWRTKGAVTGIKNQGQCGSCWAFSTTGAVESGTDIYRQSLPNLSEQQLVDCSGSYGNQGCNGGLMDNAFKYVAAQGLVTEGQYPYQAVQGPCRINSGPYKISGYRDVSRGSTQQLQAAVTQAPTSVAVDATNWQFYGGGVFTNCQQNLDHGVLAVGFDGSSNWIVKNSWGTGWGEAGYITLGAGNTCGVSNAASYPTY